MVAETNAKFKRRVRVENVQVSDGWITIRGERRDAVRWSERERENGWWRMTKCSSCKDE